MKQSLTIAMVCIVLFTLSCKKEVVEHQQPFTPTQPQGKIIMVGNFEIAQQTLDKWVYSTKMAMVCCYGYRKISLRDSLIQHPFRLLHLMFIILKPTDLLIVF
jgi:hypothetical protein